MGKKRCRRSSASPQQLFERDWQAFTTQFPEFLDEIVYRPPAGVRQAFGGRADEPEMALNTMAIFGFCVWQQAYGKGNADFRDAIVSLFLAKVPGALELRNSILRRCAHARAEGGRSRCRTVEGRREDDRLVVSRTKAEARVVPHERERFVEEHSTLEATQMNPSWRWRGSAGMAMGAAAMRGGAPERAGPRAHRGRAVDKVHRGVPLGRSGDVRQATSMSPAGHQWRHPPRAPVPQVRSWPHRLGAARSRAGLGPVARGLPHGASTVGRSSVPGGFRHAWGVGHPRGGPAAGFRGEAPVPG